MMVDEGTDEATPLPAIRQSNPTLTFTKQASDGDALLMAAVKAPNKHSPVRRESRAYAVAHEPDHPVDHLQNQTLQFSDQKTYIVNEYGERRQLYSIKTIPNIVRREGETFNYKWLPDKHAKQKMRQLPASVQKFFGALGLMHILHIVMAGSFLYFSVNWVTSAYSVPPQGCYSTDNNGTKSIVLWWTITDQSTRDECEKYGRWLTFSQGSWRAGIIMYCLFSGGFAVVSMFLCYVGWRHVKFLQPKSTRAVLNSLLLGFPEGTFMVSYSWRDEPEHGFATGHLPRTVASHFTCGWLDIENLIPGTSVKDACRNAARQALFRFAFISSNYLASPNCMVEWDMIKPDPGRCFIFYYPSTPPAVIAELQSMGHYIVPINPETRPFMMDPDWLLTHLFRSRLFNPFFQLHSPGINERWHSTLRFWFGHSDWNFLKWSLPLIVASVALICIDFLLAYVNSFKQLMWAYPPAAVIFSFSMILPAMTFFIGLYIIWYLRSTGYAGSVLPDVIHLLIFLRELGIIDPIQIYTNADVLLTDPDFQTFIASGAATLVEDVEEADIKCLLLDTVVQGSVDDALVDDSFVFYSDVGYLGLSDYARDVFGKFIIGETVPTLEFLGTKMLMLLFGTPAEDLTVGSNPFKTLFGGDQILDSTFNTGMEKLRKDTARRCARCRNWFNKKNKVNPT